MKPARARHPRLPQIDSRLDAAALADAFCARHALNQVGGFRARVARWRVMHWLLLQRLRMHLWVRAPLFFGQTMWVLTGETTSRGILAFGYSEVALTALMLRTLQPGMQFVDVGAHLGYEALLASTLVGAEGRVVSFEPQRRIFDFTVRNLTSFQQAKVIQSAVSDFSGLLQFNELPPMLSAFSGSKQKEVIGRATIVPVTTLADSLLGDGRRVDFIKVDVEGDELAVLRGAREILKRDLPLLVLEAEMPAALSLRPRVREFSEFLSPLGYHGLAFDFDGGLKLAPLGGLVAGHANVAFVPERRAEFQSLRSAIE